MIIIKIISFEVIYIPKTRYQIQRFYKYMNTYFNIIQPIT